MSVHASQLYINFMYYILYVNFSTLGVSFSMFSFYPSCSMWLCAIFI